MIKYADPRQHGHDWDWVRSILNNLYQIEHALAGDQVRAMRYVERMKDTLRERGWFFEDPHGQGFSETRSDLEASISGDSVDDLVVVDVIKPIIRWGDEKSSRVVQKGVVIVEARAHGRIQ